MASPAHSSMTPTSGRWGRLRSWLFSPEPAVSMAIFRMLWGGLMAWESWRYLVHGWVYSYYVAPSFLFKYPGFDWVQRLDGPGMNAVSVVMIVAAGLVCVGLAYRAASVAFFLTHTYEFLLGAANYLNHAYLISLLAGLMILIPAHRTLSLDALLRPKIAAAVVPSWGRALLRIQLGIVYVYGAIAKFNEDWMVYHQPVRRWMKGSADRIVKVPWIHHLDPLVPIKARLHDIVAAEGFTVFIAYGGVVFDLLIVPALVWKKTRPVAVVAAVVFHVANMHLFSIGVFPWLMLAATTLFLVPDWPYRVPWLGPRVEHAVRWIAARGQGGPTLLRGADLWAGLWVGWIAVQLLVPLRHHLYPGDVAWTEEGHVCSWRMKLRSKRGSVTYRVVDTVSAEHWTVNPADELTKRQARKIRGKPDMIRQYAHELVRRYREEQGRVVEVYVDAFTSLNYREPQRFIDPAIDLGHQPRTWGHATWILPMQWSEPPHPGGQR